MKKLFRILVFLGLIVACDRIEYDVFLKPTATKMALSFTEDTTYVFKYKDTTAHILFESNFAWVVKMDKSTASWLSLSRTAGVPGEYDVDLKAQKNRSIDERRGSFSILVGDTSFVLYVKQDPADLLLENDSLRDTVMYLDGSQQDTSFVFYANVDWTATVDEASSSWLTVEPSGTKKDTKLRIHVTKNDLPERTGFITVKGEETTFTIKIVQGYGDEFVYDASATTIEVEYPATTELFKFDARVDWTASIASTDNDWLHLKSDKGEAADGCTLEIEIKENKSASPRTGTITITGVNSSITITVIQGAGLEFVYDASKTTIPVDYTASSKTFTFDARVDWKASTDDKWLSLKPTPDDGSAGEGCTLDISIEENTTASSRTGTITIQGVNSSITITVIQGAGDEEFVYDASKTTIEVDYPVTTEWFEFFARVDWKASTKDGWLHLKSAEGKAGEGCSLEIGIDENKSASPRTGTITIQGVNSSITITVIQGAGLEFVYNAFATSIKVDYPVSTELFTFDARVDWKASTNDSWLRLKSNQGKAADGCTLEIDIEENKSASPRTGTITIQGVKSSITIEVIQGAGLEFVYDASKATIPVDYTASSKTFTFDARVDWKASTKDSWLRIKPIEGKAAEGCTLDIGIDENTNSSSRTGTITIQGVNSSITITVIQGAGDEEFVYDASKKTIEVDYPVTTEWFEFFARVAWTASTKDGWLHLKSAEGKAAEDCTLEIEIEENKSASSRMGTITIQGVNSSITITVIQGAGLEFVYEASKTDIQVEYPATTDESFTFDARVAWTATSKYDWITFGTDKKTSTSSDVLGEHTLTLNIEENKTASPRKDTITIKGVDSTFTLTVTQGAGLEFVYEASKTTIPVDYTASSKTFTFDARVDWKASTDDKWLRIKPIEGKAAEGCTLDIGIDENTTTSSRTGTITIQGVNSSITITVIQGASDEEFVYDASKTTIEVDYPVTTEWFEFFARVAWTASTQDDWLHLKSAEGKAGEGCNFEIGIDENKSASPRTGTITIQGVNSSIRIEVIQGKGLEFVYEASNTDIQVEYPATTESFTFEARVGWTATTDDKWLSLKPTPDDGSAAQKCTLDIGIEENKSASSRKGTITIKGDDSTFTVTVTQKRGLEFVYKSSETSILTDYTEKMESFTFNARVDWKATTDVDWITFGTEKTDDFSSNVLGDHKLEINVAESFDRAERVGHVTIQGKEETITITVTQTNGTEFEFNPDATNIRTDYTKKTETFPFNDRVAWEASTTDDWITLGPDEESDFSSSVLGKQILEIHVAESFERTDRVGHVTIKGTDETITITVTQTPGPEFIYEPDETDIQVEYPATTESFTFEARVGWTATTTDDWLILDPTPADGSAAQKCTLKIDIKENKTASSRQGTIMIKGDDSTFTLTVTQGAGLEFVYESSATSIITDYKKQDKSFQFDARVAWEASTDDGWITLGPNEKNSFSSDVLGGHTLEIHVAESFDREKRVGYVTITGKNETIKITVTQTNGTEFLYNSDATTIRTDYTKKTETFPFNARVGWEASTTDDWITFGPNEETSFSSDVLGDHTLEIHVAESFDRADRVGTVTITGKDETIIITVTQTPGPEFIYEPDATGIQVEYPATTESFTFEARVGWTATTDDKWLSLKPTPDDGSAAQKCTLDIGIEENKTASSRKGTITIKGDDSTFTVTVTQGKGEEFVYEASKTDIQVEYPATTESFTFEARVGWTATTTDDWLTLKPTPEDGSAAQKCTLKIDIEENKTASPRKDTITIKGVDSTFTVTVTQGAGLEFVYESSATNITTDYTEKTDTFQFNARVVWEASTEYDWITFGPDKTSSFSSKVLGDHKLEINVTESFDRADRVGTVTITGKDETIIITVTQTPGPEFIYEPDATDIEVEYPATTDESFTFDARVAWEATTKSDWITFGTDKKTSTSSDVLGKHTLTLNIEENKTASPRKDTITIKGVDSTFTLIVTQGKGLEFVYEASKTDIEVEYPATTDESFTFDARVGWTATSKYDWITFGTDKKTSISSDMLGKHTLTLNIEENKTASPRKDTITIKGVDSTFILTVTQGKGLEFVYNSSEPSILTDYTEKTDTFSFNARVAWEASTKDAWITLGPDKTSSFSSKVLGDHKLEIHVTESFERKDRVGTVTITGKDETITITVTQTNGNEFLYNSDATSITANYEKQDKSFPFNARVVWKASTDDDWITLGPNEKNEFSSDVLGPNTLTIHIAESFDRADRVGTVTITGKEETIKITVTQTPGPEFIFDSDATSISTNYKEDVKEFKFRARVQWTTSLANGADWITYDPTSEEIGDQTININFISENLDEAEERVETITVKGIEESFDIKLTQYEFDIFLQMDDNNFKAACKNFDANNNGRLSIAEGREVQKIMADNKNIRSVKGIEYFLNLDTLQCDHNKIDTLKLQANTKLKFISCSYNQVKSLDVSNLKELRRVTIQNNVLDTLKTVGCAQLSRIDVENNPLRYVDITNCPTFTAAGRFKNLQLTYFNATNCTGLQLINVSNNKLKTLILDGCTELDSINCTSNNLTTLDISSCTNLRKLHCSSNQLTALNLQQNKSLEVINCASNQITALDLANRTTLKDINVSNNKLKILNLTGCTALTKFSISNNLLETINITECINIKTLTYTGSSYLKTLNTTNCTALRKIVCSNNQLTTLIVKGCTALDTLDCSTNKLKSFDVTTCTALKRLICKANELTSLNIKQNTSLRYINFESNTGITEFDASGLTKLAYIYGTYCSNLSTIRLTGCSAFVGGDFSKTAIVFYDLSGCTSKTTMGIADFGGLQYVNISGCTAMKTASIINCGLNNFIAEGCTALDSLNITKTSVRTLNLSNLPALKKLDVRNNTSLTTLKCDEKNGNLLRIHTQGCTALKTLNCSNNKVKTIDISTCTALNTLTCKKNQLTKLDVTQNLNLKELDVSDNTTLTELKCVTTNGNLTSLNISNTKLTSLACQNNKLTTLTLTNCTTIKTLNCSSNQLTALDVAQFTQLETLNCSSNKIATLNVDNCPAIKTLNCSSNQLTELNLTNNTLLEALSVKDNQLTALNVGSCTALKTLDCSSNQLSTIESLSSCVNLTKLSCSNNSMGGSFKASANLKYLDCASNQITQVDVTENTLLDTLICSHNAITELNVENLFAVLKYVDASDNATMTSLTTNASGTGPLAYVNVKNCVALTSLNTSNYSSMKYVAVTGCSALTYLNCNSNSGITSLDLTGCSALTELQCEKLDKLTSLDVTPCVHLKTLKAPLCGITTFTCITDGTGLLEQLDLSATPLTVLDCKNNKLTSLVLNSSTLETVSCSGNQLTTLDLRDNPALTTLNCNPMSTLTTILLKTGQTIETLDKPSTTNIEYAD